MFCIVPFACLSYDIEIQRIKQRIYHTRMAHQNVQRMKNSKKESNKIYLTWKTG
eukprot:m.173520 g.173520  ORF g.173520 m.173520 type:complete len:54 (+) comp15388_c0_seq20:976-1137(+)